MPRIVIACKLSTERIFQLPMPTAKIASKTIIWHTFSRYSSGQRNYLLCACVCCLLFFLLIGNLWRWRCVGVLPLTLDISFRSDVYRIGMLKCLCKSVRIFICTLLQSTVNRWVVGGKSSTFSLHNCNIFYCKQLFAVAGRRQCCHERGRRRDKKFVMQTVKNNKNCTDFCCKNRIEELIKRDERRVRQVLKIILYFWAL